VVLMEVRRVEVMIPAGVEEGARGRGKEQVSGGSEHRYAEGHLPPTSPATGLRFNTAPPSRSRHCRRGVRVRCGESRGETQTRAQGPPNCSALPVRTRDECSLWLSRSGFVVGPRGAPNLSIYGKTASGTPSNHPTPSSGGNSLTQNLGWGLLLSLALSSLASNARLLEQQRRLTCPTHPLANFLPGAAEMFDIHVKPFRNFAQSR